MGKGVSLFIIRENDYLIFYFAVNSIYCYFLVYIIYLDKWKGIKPKSQSIGSEKG